MTGQSRKRSNLPVVAGVVAVIGAMGTLVAYSPTLYVMFCEATGFGGTTKRADAAPKTAGERVFTVRFDSNTDQGLPWKFKPMQTRETVQVGENGLAFYEARNSGAEAVVGTATYSVTPHKAAPYFVKIDCFCFTEQVLQPGERVDMPVSYFVDPEILNDRNLDDVTTITLSYTFYRAKDQHLATPPKQTSRAAPAGLVSGTADVN
ncbi:cytochrome c oxidase assembly protein [Falsiroseomonas sp.]|uniref:cytochrome c oxidase assembly protein n=1 Tax=Falsiroseomonas sp. TaxID=2870721 RepID=UPI00272934F4|nr:cytochrome c oxidase assembly protein [Falsiroseomonas sp.]MDO9502302.1 cytochrome c oxidase assembly protein [Falsiroseomonas sp.]